VYICMMYTCVYTRYTYHTRCTPRIYVIYASHWSAAHFTKMTGTPDIRHVRTYANRARAHYTTRTPKRYNRRHQIHLRASTPPRRQATNAKYARLERRDARHCAITDTQLARSLARAHTHTRAYFGVCQVISCARYSFPFADPQSGSRP